MLLLFAFLFKTQIDTALGSGNPKSQIMKTVIVFGELSPYSCSILFLSRHLLEMEHQVRKTFDLIQYDNF